MLLLQPRELTCIVPLFLWPRNFFMIEDLPVVFYAGLKNEDKMLQQCDMSL